jgi:hypothetical protein
MGELLFEARFSPVDVLFASIVSYHFAKYVVDRINNPHRWKCPRCKKAEVKTNSKMALGEYIRIHELRCNG